MHTVESTWVGDKAKSVSQIRFYVIPPTSHCRDDDDFAFLHTGVRKGLKPDVVFLTWP